MDKATGGIGLETIEAKEISHAYDCAGGRKRSLRGVTLEVHRGELLAVLGQNGCGKSTLVKHFNGLVPLQEGALTVAGLDLRAPKNLRAVRRACGMMGFSVASDILEILDAPVTVAEKPDAAKSGIDRGLPDIRFENVSFRYSSKRDYAPQDLSIEVEPGQTVAIVGASGSGKSTLVNLLLRFYEVTDGSVTINGVDLRDYDLTYLRSRIAVVFQTSFLFYGTVRENIAMAAPDATDEEIVAAAKAANAHEFISALPKGYDTMQESGDVSGRKKI